MRILYISSAWPADGGFGGQLRALHIARALQRMGRVSVVVVGSDAGDLAARRRSEVEFEVLPPVLPIVWRNRTVLHRLRGAVDLHYLNLHGYVAPPAARQRIWAAADEADLVWVFNARTPNILLRWAWLHAHVDLDDIPSTYLRNVSRHGATARERWKARLQHGLGRRREKLFARRFTTVSVCSQADRAYLGNGDTTHVIPNGFRRPVTTPTRTPSQSPPRLGFIGLFSHRPNVEGVRWFLDRCWPLVRQARPDVRLRLVGQGSDSASLPDAGGVERLGWVEDPAAEIATWSAMIVPIRIGAGTRIKIADAFSRKCPIVSTSLGAFGYEVEDRIHLRMADHPSDFAAACIELVGDRVTAEAMAERGWNAFLAQWTWDAIAPRVWAAAEDCLRRSRPHATAALNPAACAQT